MTSRNVFAIVLLSLLAFSSIGCPSKQKDGGASAETSGSAASAVAKAPKGDDKDGDKDGEKDDDEDDEKDAKDANKKDEGGW